MDSLTQKLKVILWKSSIIRKRHWLLSLFEIVAPLLLYYLFNRYLPSSAPDTQGFEIGKPQGLDELIENKKWQMKRVAYAPNNSVTNEFFSEYKKYIDADSDIANFSSENQLDEWLLENSQNYFDPGIGIVFKSDGQQNNLLYTIKVHEQELMPIKQRFGFPTLTDNYIRSLFSIIQMLLDSIFIKKLTGKIFNVKLQHFPMKMHDGPNAANAVFPFVTTFSFVFVIPGIIRNIVEEKLTGIKELQKMMGLQYWMWWGGWLVHSLVIYSVSIVIITGMFKFDWGDREGGSLVYEIDSWVIILFLFFLFIVATILFCFAVSTFFKSPNLAMISCILLWIVPPFVFIEELVLSSPMSSVTQMMTCLSPPLCLSWGFSIFMNMQTSGEIWNWNLFFKRATSGGLSTAHIVFMFLLDWLIFALITWYVSSVKPGPYGRAKPLYFIFQLWKKDKEIVGSAEDEGQLHYEPVPEGTKVGISIQNIRKVFGSKVAVDKVNLDVYEGEIMALLGHNGAGKTTTMSIITGLFSPTKGKVVVDGRNIFDDMDKFQQNLGLCPQHNLLFSYFTVIEHLIFFGMMKGLSSERARSTGHKLLSQLHMEDKSSQFPGKISGGMKRKLCLAISLMGDPKVLMLDEPTAGMDPESRREVWDILLSYRGNRTIIITTHFMEEADVLGDRIAIMDHGRVSCYGTSIYLKKLYGTGYQVVISKNNSSREADITSVVESQFPGSKLKSTLPTQLTYTLSGDDTSKFSQLFSTLERDRTKLGITGIGINCTTMEDVFLRVAEIAVIKDFRLIPSEELLRTSPSAITKKRVSGILLPIQQISALFKKKLIFMKRTWLSTITFALIHLLALLVILKGTFGGGDEGNMSEEISLKNLYPDYEVPYTVTGDKHLEQVFKSLVSQQGNSPRKAYGNISQDLITNIKKDKSYYRKAVVGADFNKTTYTGLYNSFASHSVPVVLNLISNTILRQENSNGSIVVISHPYSSAKSLVKDKCSETNMKSQLNHITTALPWLLVALGVSVTVTRAMALHISERASGVKQLQLMSSLPSVLYWLAHFLLDFSFYFISILIVWLATWIFDTNRDIVASGKMSILFFVLLLYGISAIPFVYIISFMFKSSPKAMSFVLIFNIISGIIAPLVGFGLTLDNTKEKLGWKYALVDTLLRINPLYSETAALIRLVFVMALESVCHNCSTQCPDFKIFDVPQPLNSETGKLFALVNIREYVILLMFQWIFFWLLIFVVERGLLKAGWARLSSLWVGPITRHRIAEDEDVLRERERTKNNQNAAVLKVCGLGKKYSRKLTAVNEASFLVEKGECFGLLGVNGAGKTTTFMMLTGEVTPTVGTASISQYDLISQKTKYLQEIGYCPQFSAIIDLLTGEEMLQLFAALRGIDDISTEVQQWIQYMGLEEFRKVQCGKYSGGNKRKLSTAVALVGDMPVVFLDEPTAGVDPVSRRKLWNVLAECQRKGQVIVLTSHSMEECEALCSRLTIMVAGHMKCIGSTQHIKQRFGQGYTIMLKLSASSPDFDMALATLKNAVARKFPNCFIKDEHRGLLHYHLVDNSVPLSQLFGNLESLRAAHPLVEDYTVGDTTLEQVFMSFARQGTSSTEPVPV